MNKLRKYYKIKNYSMKCRLYPNKEEAKRIDDAIMGVQCYHNCALYDMFTNYSNTNPKPYKPKKEDKLPKRKKRETDKEYAERCEKYKLESKNKHLKRKKGETDKEYEERCEQYELKSKYKHGDIIHFANLESLMSAGYKNMLIEDHKIIACAVPSSITTNVGLKADIKKSLGSNPIEFQRPKYYSKSKPRRSYTYNQETFSKIHFIGGKDGKTKKKDSEELLENNNVFYISLNRIGTVKVRGWNKKIRFNEEHTIDFRKYVEINKKENVTITVSKDNCGDYWIIFKLSDVYKPINENCEKGEVGVDVGVKDIAILSNGKKYENKQFKKKNKKKLKALNRRMSRRMGYSNIKFRDERKKNPDLKQSKRYIDVKLAHAKLERKIARQRNHYNNEMTTEIVANNNLIGVESLRIRNMFRNRHLAYALSDAAMGSVLEMIKYKSEWYGRECKEINQWTPSSKECSSCGYKNENLTLAVREWTCPECGTHHDRDINAAKNILKYAIRYNIEEEVA